jgi:site-specific DNA recombinase
MSQCPPPAVKAAIYLRVSTIDQGKHGFSIPEQRKACLHKAESLVKAIEAEKGSPRRLETFEFLDTAGGDLLERPELERVRAFVKESRPAFFICLDPDRFSRATYQAILVANEIEAAGVRLEFVQHDYQSTSEGRLFFTLRVAIAEYEKAKILERTARGKRGKMEAGGIPHRMNVFGYDHISAAALLILQKTGVADVEPLMPNATEAAWIRQMYGWVANEQLGSQAVAERLNAIGVPAKNGGGWHRGVVADILRNTIYIGRLRLNRFETTGLGSQLQLPKERRTKRLTAKIRPEDEWIEVGVPAIVSSELFERVQSVLAQIKRRSSTRIHPGRKGHFLSGVMTCGLCGGPVHYIWNNHVNSYLVRCGNRYPPVRGLKVPHNGCEARHQKVVFLEQQVWDQIKRWFSSLDLLKAEMESPVVTDDWGEANLEALLTRQTEEAKSRQTKILYLVSKGVVHQEVAELQLADIKRSLDGLEQELISLLRSKMRDDQRKQNCEQVTDLNQEIQVKLADMDRAQRQRLARMLIQEVRVFPGGKVEVIPNVG